MLFRSRKAAENFANFTNKGSLVGIDGRLQTRNYENQQGQRVYVTEVVVENFSLLESRAESEKRNSGHSNNNFNQAPNYNNNNQFTQNQPPISSNNNSYGNNSGNGNNYNNYSNNDNINYTIKNGTKYSY